MTKDSRFKARVKAYAREHGLLYIQAREALLQEERGGAALLWPLSGREEFTPATASRLMEALRLPVTPSSWEDLRSLLVALRPAPLAFGVGWGYLKASRSSLPLMEALQSLAGGGPVAGPALPLESLYRTSFAVEESLAQALASVLAPTHGYLLYEEDLKTLLMKRLQDEALARAWMRVVREGSSAEVFQVEQKAFPEGISQGEREYLRLLALHAPWTMGRGAAGRMLLQQVGEALEGEGAQEGLKALLREDPRGLYGDATSEDPFPWCLTEEPSSSSPRASSLPLVTAFFTPGEEDLSDLAEAVRLTLEEGRLADGAPPRVAVLDLRGPLSGQEEAERLLLQALPHHEVVLLLPPPLEASDEASKTLRRWVEAHAEQLVVVSEASWRGRDALAAALPLLWEEAEDPHRRAGLVYLRPQERGAEVPSDVLAKAARPLPVLTVLPSSGEEVGPSLLRLATSLVGPAFFSLAEGPR